jgi:hypothetical protein
MSDTERGETLPGRSTEPPPAQPAGHNEDRPPPASGGALPAGPQGDEVDPGVG